VLTLSNDEIANFVNETRKNLHQKLSEAKFWRNLAENDHVTINGISIGP
jgi:hypothetical protein